VPMILGGDELLRTQHGNNNAWCQDNPMSWLEWSLKNRHAGFLRFVKMLIAFRKAHPILRRRTFFRGDRGRLPPEIVWHGVEPAQPDFSHDSHALAFALDGRTSDRPNVIDRDIYVAMNGYVKPLDFRIPAAPSGRPWRRFIDTALPSPEDIVEEDRGPRVPIFERYRLEAHATIILVSE
jgi:isoamylase